MGIVGRVFFNGGHSVVTRTPEEAPFIGFRPGQYAKEASLNLLPGFIVSAVNERAVYSGNYYLTNYGFMLSEEHQVGVSLLGSLWLLGGWAFLVVGAIFVALLQLAAILLVMRYQRSSPAKGLWFVSILAGSFLWFSGRNVLMSSRQVFWSWILAWLSYYMIVRPLVIQNEREFGIVGLPNRSHAMPPQA
jgi:hypothetical protein